MTAADLVSLIPVLFTVGGVVLSAVVLVLWWWFRNRRAGTYRRGVRVPLAGAIGLDPGGVR
ncbi:MAG: hypothetical protein ACRDTC_04035 [Pseudonocardiaceae bacterium]